VAQGHQQGQGDQGQGGQPPLSKDDRAELPLDEQSSAKFQQLLNAAGLTADYTTGDGEFALEEIANSLSELKRLKQDRQVPEQYDFGLPKDFKGGGGFEWKPDPKFTQRIQTVGKELALPQEDMSKLVVAYAEHQLEQMNATKQEELQVAQQAQAERAKLGPQANERIKALKQWFDAQHGEGAGEEFFKGHTARGVTMLEDLVQRAHGAGRSAPNRGGDPAKPNPGADIGKPGGARKLLHAAYG
jgi:hypothetical protein